MKNYIKNHKELFDHLMKIYTDKENSMEHSKDYPRNIIKIMYMKGHKRSLAHGQFDCFCNFVKNNYCDFMDSILTLLINDVIKTSISKKISFLCTLLHFKYDMTAEELKKELNLSIKTIRDRIDDGMNVGRLADILEIIFDEYSKIHYIFTSQPLPFRYDKEEEYRETKAIFYANIKKNR